MTTYGFDPDAPATSEVDRGVTRDGLEQLRRRWVVADPWAAVVIVHGIGEHSGRYEHVGAQLADAGLVTVGFDLRGFGASDGRKAYVDRFDQYHDDVEDQLTEVRALGVPTVLLGHSMGGLIAASYVLHDRPQPDLLVLSAPALGADAPTWQRKAVGPLSRLAPKLSLKTPVDSNHLSRDPALAAAYDNDPLVQRHATVRLAAELLDTIDWTRDHLSDVAVPTLVMHGGDDVLVPTESSAIFETVPRAERRVYPGLRHEIFNEPEGPDVIAELIAWIDASIG